jgi:hypothetical protein
LTAGRDRHLKSCPAAIAGVGESHSLEKQIITAGQLFLWSESYDTEVDQKCKTKQGDSDLAGGGGFMSAGYLEMPGWIDEQ